MPDLTDWTHCIYECKFTTTTPL